MRRDIRIERLLPHPPARVWRALTDASALGAWLMPNDLEPVLHHRFTFRMAPQRGWDGLTHCEVIELDPPRRIAFSYRGRASGEKTIRCAGVESEAVQSVGRGVMTELDTVLRFTLEPARDGTRLVLEHTGFTGAKLVLVSHVIGWGWSRSVLPRLPRVLGDLARRDGSPDRAS